MYKKIISHLNNVIADNQFVNCIAPAFDREDDRDLKRFRDDLRRGIRNLQVHVDSQAFQDCKNEEQEAAVLLEMINHELEAVGQPAFSKQELSISSALKKWGDQLQKRVVVVFHFFHDTFGEKEKNILRSIRKAVRYVEEDQLSPRLGILILSDRPVSDWELLPESNLDKRHVVFFELNDS